MKKLISKLGTILFICSFCLGANSTKADSAKKADSVNTTGSMNTTTRFIVGNDGMYYVFYHQDITFVAYDMWTLTQQTGQFKDTYCDITSRTAQFTVAGNESVVIDDAGGNTLNGYSLPGQGRKNYYAVIRGFWLLPTGMYANGSPRG